MLAKHVATVYLEQSVVIDTDPNCRTCYRMFDLSSGDYIVEIPLAWEITEMGKKLEKTVLHFNYARYELRHNTSPSGNGG